MCIKKYPYSFLMKNHGIIWFLSTVTLRNRCFVDHKECHPLRRLFYTAKTNRWHTFSIQTVIVSYPPCNIWKGRHRKKNRGRSSEECESSSCAVDTLPQITVSPVCLLRTVSLRHYCWDSTIGQGRQGSSQLRTVRGQGKIWERNCMDTYTYTLSHTQNWSWHCSVAVVCFFSNLQTLNHFFVNEI